MKLPRELVTVTPLSKAVALLIFISAPVIAFLLGVKYQSDLTKYAPPVDSRQMSCAEEVKICPDGTYVGRTGPNCEFIPCPALEGNNEEDLFCGGITGIVCPTGYVCSLDGNFPDAGGICIQTFN